MISILGPSGTAFRRLKVVYWVSEKVLGAGDSTGTSGSYTSRSIPVIIILFPVAVVFFSGGEASKGGWAVLVCYTASVTCVISLGCLSLRT